MSDHDDHDPAEPSAEHVRSVLTAAGHQVPARGRMSAENMRLYYDTIGRDDYDGGVTREDFDPPGDDEHDTYVPDELEHQADDELEAGRREETTPRSHRPTAADRARQLWAKRGSKDKPKGRGRARRTGRRRHDWVPTQGFIERVWSELAYGASKVPSLQRVFAAQAPMAGIILQDAAQDTFVDRIVLQPLARGEDRLEAANAMLGPPFWTVMIGRFGGFPVEAVMRDGQQLFIDGQPVVRPVMGDDGMPAWNEQTRVMIGGLRMSLMSWLRISARRADEIIERANELDDLGSQADELVKWILSPPVPGQTYHSMTREARQRTMEFLRAGQPAPDDVQAPDDDDQVTPTPAPATPGHPASVASALGWPDQAAPDPRGLSFTPPDARIASQVVPRAPMPQA